jgi:hypothetical protein
VITPDRYDEDPCDALQRRTVSRGRRPDRGEGDIRPDSVRRLSARHLATSVSRWLVHVVTRERRVHDEGLAQVPALSASMTPSDDEVNQRNKALGGAWRRLPTRVPTGSLHYGPRSPLGTPVPEFFDGGS